MSTKEHPEPVEGFTSAAFYNFLNEHKLMGSRCATCGAIYLPPRPVCPHCQDSEMEWVEMSGQGKLVAFTVVHIAPTAMLAAGYNRKNPYCVGVVQVEEGPSISAQILGVDVTHPETIGIGTPVTVDFVERGAEEMSQTFLAFKP